MADTTYTNGVTLTDADWFNDVNRLHYTILGDPANAAAVRTSIAAAGTADANTFTAQQSFTGTAATAPAIAGASDPNTGVFFPAADTVAVSTGGEERMRIDTTGKITASTTTGPNSHVFTSTAASTESNFRFDNTQATSGSAISVSNSGLNKQFSARVNSTGGIDFYTGQAAASASTTGVAVFKMSETGNALVINATGGLGYGTGAGGTVTQGTSRTTGVTLSKPTGAITLFTAAGSATPATFTVTNSLVAATDTVVLSVKSGTNVYLTAVTAVAAGSFNVTFWTTGGTASDAPVINFAIIKGATS